MATDNQAHRDLEADVAHLLDQMYAAYLAGDITAIDRHLAGDFTIFDSVAPDLVHGREGLTTLRANRLGANEAEEHEDVPARTVTNIPATVRETALTVSDLVVRPIGPHVLAAFWLRVDAVDTGGKALAPELLRNSAWLVQEGGELRIAHLHEDVRQPLGG
jgi:hypothetical protein